MQAIHSITYNWFYTPEGEGEYRRTVGVDGVTDILKHEAVYVDQPYPIYYTVHYENGDMLEIYNPNTVSWKKQPGGKSTEPLVDIPF